MTKLSWISFTISGLILMLGYNILLVKRDAKMLFSPPQLEQPVYKQLPVIPFTNWYYEYLNYTPYTRYANDDFFTRRYKQP